MRAPSPSCFVGRDVIYWSSFARTTGHCSSTSLTVTAAVVPSSAAFSVAPNTAIGTFVAHFANAVGRPAMPASVGSVGAFSSASATVLSLAVMRVSVAVMQSASFACSGSSH